MPDKIDKIYQSKIESDTSDATKRLMALVNGAAPETEEEEEMVKEIEAARKKGQVIYIPSD